jgi:hypothetical protein
MGRKRLVPALLGVAVVGLVGAVAGTALASGGPGTTGTASNVLSGVEVPGLTGAAAQRSVSAAADRFRALTPQRVAAARAANAAAPDAVVQPDELHTAWGIFFRDTAGSGLQATHSVYNLTTHGDDFLYAPTALPPGGACTEMTTAYTPSGPRLWAWDWCGGRDTVGKVVNIDSSFLNTYTTSLNGAPAYTMRETQTSTSNNAWTVYLFNYTTQAWDTFYATSGTKDIPGSSWDFFEVYTTVDASTGAGYYCADGNGKAFEASGVQVTQNGAWTAANSSNSSLDSPPSGSTFDCPSLRFSIVHANDHWVGKIGNTPPTTAPPTTKRPTTAPPTTTTPTTRPPTTAPASGACSASYSQVGSWQGGFQGTVTVTAGNSAVNGWTVKVTLPNGVTISQLWNGTLSGSAPSYTVRNATYNGALAANTATSFGFLASGTALTPTLSCTSP